MRLNQLLFLGVGILSCHVIAQAASDWDNQVARFTSSPRFDKSTWGIELVDLKFGRGLFATNEHVLLKLASNQKIFTAAWALAELGPNASITTLVRIHGKIDAQGVLNGDLVISGAGDPTWGSDRLFASGNHHWDAFLGLIRAAHIRQINGRLVADVSRVTGSRWGTNRLATDLIHSYAAEISALNEHENFVVARVHSSRMGSPAQLVITPATGSLAITNRTMTVGAEKPLVPLSFHRTSSAPLIYVTGEVRTNAVPQRFELAVSDPAAWFLDRLRKKLNESGVPVGGEDFVTGSMEGFSDCKILGEIQSPPMHEMISIMLKESQNLYAETLFRFTGEKMRQNLTGNFTSEQSAVLNMTDWLIARGINRAELRVEDGSGLSRGTLSSAHALVTLLRWSREWEHHSLFRSLLPLAGVDGTLRNRFIGSRLSRKLWAKTGSLNGVATLSGFMEGVQGDPLVFSVLLNNYQPTQGKNAREVVDELVELLSHWEPPK